MKTHTILILCLSFCIVAFNTASAQKKSKKDNDTTTVKPIAPPEGKAVVYIVRPSSLGFAVKFKVECDGRYIGSTKGKRYIYTVIEPGPHVFMSKAENKSELPFVAEAGAIYFLEQEVRMGALKARNELVRLDEVQGRDKLDKCKLSEDNVTVATGSKD